ncbi:MAG: hypothetical protein OEZ43_05105 [Gammaproteobacteria bacterium]|nr:hypothetical protein [Gammaproteobacteria bacterium]
MEVGLVKSFLGVLATLLIVTFNIAGAAEETFSASDDSQKKYERKVLLQIRDIGLQQKHFSVPVTFCPYKKSCVPFATWGLDVDDNLEIAAAGQVIERMSGNRYDNISIQSGKLVMTTLNETLEMDADLGQFNFDVGPYYEFVTKSTEYLNTKFAPFMGELLIKAKDARYQELADREKETFLAEIAKERSVPVAFLQRLLNSAFVFATYLETPRGKISISQQKSKKSFNFSVGVDIDLPMRMVIFRFDSEKKQFEIYKELSAHSGYVSDSAQVFPSRPENVELLANLYRRSFVVAARAAGIALNTNLKEDDAFAIFATVDAVDEGFFLTRIESAIGQAEDLRIDAPYRLKQMIDGKIVNRGWIKARSVARKSLLDDGAQGQYLSSFSVIKGSAEFKDQVREHPWTGVLGALTVVNTHQTVEKLSGLTASGGGDFLGLGLGFKADLGYLFNSSGYSESWLEIVGQFGLGGESIVQSSSIYTTPVLGVVRMDYVKRGHLGASGLFVAYKFGLAASQMRGQGPNVDSANDDIEITSFGLGAGLQLGYLFSPDTELVVNAQGYFPISSQYRIGESETYDDANMSVVYGINVGLSFHMKSLGGLASLMR